MNQSNQLGLIEALTQNINLKTHLSMDIINSHTADSVNKANIK